MSINKEAILIALIHAGHVDAIEHGWDLLQSGDSAVATGTVKTGELIPGENIGTVTDSTVLDARGLPWDSRINAKTKTKDAKGNWKYAVGIDREVLVPQVEAELRGQAVAGTVVNPPANGAPLVQTQAPLVQTGAPVIGSQPGLPPVLGAQAVAPQVVQFPIVNSAAEVTADNLQQTVAALIAKHGVPVAQALLEKFGATDVTQIQPGEGNVNLYNFFVYASNDDYLRHISVL